MTAGGARILTAQCPRGIFGGGEPELWERLPASTLRPYLSKAKADWQSANYEHAAWLFGTGDLPKSLDYSLGIQVSRTLSDRT